MAETSRVLWSTWKRATAVITGKRGALLFCFLAAFPLLLSQEPQKSASIGGTVHDLSGSPLAGARIKLQPPGSAQAISTATDAKGKYAFSGLLPGVYQLTISATGFNDSQIPSFSFSGEAKQVDVTLPVAKAVPGSAMQPQFSDEPEFTVAGVKDTTNLGGHGSDVVVHTRNNLAKETASLGKAAGTESAAETSEGANSLRGRLEREPNNAELYHQLAIAEEKLGDPVEAVRQYQRAAELNPTEPYLFDWGSELLLHHAPEPAIEVFAKGGRQFPKSARMLLGLGAAQFALGSAEQAMQKLYQASDLDPKDAIPYLFLGKILDAQKAAPTEAVEKLHRFVTWQPQNAEANYYYAVALWKGQNDSADKSRAVEVKSLLNRAVQLDPKFAAAYLELGIVCSERHEISQAISAFERAAQTDPQMQEAHYRLAQLYRQLGESDKAKEELQTYEQLSRESEQQAERERHEIRQFLYTLRDQPAEKPR
ncbi:MAG: tetratricopeptide repeat protein [Candidatus Sulfotelmatobacter sp.]